MGKLVATSWDDGLETDKRLLEILDTVCVRSSFSLTLPRYKSRNIPNDARDVDQYGMLVKSSDLGMYSAHDVCNHTAYHMEVDVWNGTCMLDIWLGKIMLEDFYSQDIPGIVWPYGVFSRESIAYAQTFGHTYGRTTPAPERQWRIGAYTNWNIVPFHWRTPIKTIIESPHTHVALCGHTYELRSEDDWAHLTELYTVLSADSRCELVTLTDLSKDITKHARNQLVRV